MLARLFAAARFLLLLAVLPLTVVLYTSNAATAATYGPAVPFSFAEPSGGSGVNAGEVRCNGNAAYVINDSVTMNVKASMKCIIDRPFEQDPQVLTGTTGIQLMGATNDGQVEGCDSGAVATGNPISGVSWDVAGFTVECQVEEICISWQWDQDQSFTFDQHYSGEWCGELLMGPAPSPTTEGCPLGTPSFVTTSAPLGTGSYEGLEGRNVTIQFQLGEDATLYKHWQFETRWGVDSTVPDLNKFPWKNQATTGYSANGSTWTGTHFGTPTEVGAYGNAYAVSPEPIGTWVWAIKDPDAAWDAPVDPRIAALRPHNSYLYGDNDPMGCHFYFGPKFREDPNSTLDDPQGPQNSPDDPVPPPGGSTEPPDLTPTDPAAPAPGCEFSLSDPASWATAGICALVGLIVELIEAVKGIASAILNGIKSLFIPTDGFMDAKLDRLSGIWDETAPAKYGEALSDLSPGSASGCGGVPLTVDLGGGVTIDEHVGAACSGSMASAAGIVKLALSAMLVVGGLLASVRAVGSGFGWDPGLRSAEQ